MIKALRTAIGFLTILPVSPKEISSRDFGASVAVFPLVGLVFALLYWLGVKGLGRILPPEIAAWLTVFGAVVLNGAIHWDGFADTADGLGGHTPEQRRQVMKDSRLGAFGGIALLFLALGKVLTLSHLAGTPFPLLLCAPVLSRWAMAVLLYTQPSVSQGLLRMFEIGDRHAGIFTATLWMGILVGMGWPYSLWLLGVAGIIILLLIPWIRRTFGGLTGDILGAANELVELLILVGLVALRQ
jgi:adenosylcobinamide-GDP ribazoletransferase